MGNYPDKNDLIKYSHLNKLTSYRIQMESIIRNKRLLMAYHDYRLGLIRELHWKGKREEVNSLLSPSEIEFYKNFDEIMCKCMKNLGMDFTKLQTPPKELYGQALVTNDIEEIQLSTLGKIRLQKDSMHLIQNNDIETIMFNDKIKRI